MINWNTRKRRENSAEEILEEIKTSLGIFEKMTTLHK